jgi:hypothetical protein
LSNPSAPINVTIKVGCDRWGISRSYLYRLAGEGRIIFRKSGRRTLVDVETGDKYVLSLPTAKIKAPAEAASTLLPATNCAPPVTPVTSAASAPKRQGRGFRRQPEVAPRAAPAVQHAEMPPKTHSADGR